MLINGTTMRVYRLEVVKREKLTLSKHRKYKALGTFFKKSPNDREITYTLDKFCG